MAGFMLLREPDVNGFPQFTFKLFDYSTQVESTIWSNVTSNSAMFTAGDTDSYIQKLSMAPHFRREYRSVGFELRADPGGWYVLGHWQPASAGVLNSSVHGANIFSASDFTIEGLSTDLEGLTPLAYSYTTPLATNLGRVAAESDANAGASEIVTFYPDRVNNRDSEAFGFDGIFRIVNPDDRFEGAYLKTYFDSVSNSMNLEWNYLPMNPAHISGAVVFHKFETGGSGNQNNDSGFSLDKRPSCFDDLVKQGYIPYLTDVTSISSPVTTSYTVTPAGQTFSNPWGHKFAICPYKVANGVRTYYPTYVRNSCIGTCQDWSEQISFGRKVPGAPGHDVTISTATSFDSPPINGLSSRIVSVTFAPAQSAYYVTYNNDFSGVINIGDEVLLMVMGNNGSNSCGVAPGEGPVNAGEFEFGKVVGIADGYSIYIKSSGSHLLRGLSYANSTNLNDGANNAGFCYAQIVRVPHFGNMTFSAPGAAITAPTFTWSPSGGGIVAFRVNGNLVFTDSNNYISASYAGYPGGVAGGENGSSRGGMHPLSVSNSGGGLGANGSQSGAGGAGAHGSGGNSETASSMLINSGGNLMFNSGADQLVMRMGSGGGGGVTYPGGAGGGIVLVAARQITVASNGDNLIKASGLQATAETSPNAGGGGGGGSVNLFTLNVNKGGGTYIISPEAKGGNGAQSSIGLDGAGGGGGYVKIRTCNIGAGQTTFGGVGLFYNSQMVTPLAGTIQGGLKGAGSANSQDGAIGLIDNIVRHPICDVL